MATCSTPDCGEVSVGYYRSLRTGKMAQMCRYCHAGRDITPPKPISGKDPVASTSAIRQWTISGTLNALNLNGNHAFFDTVLHGRDGMLETIWNGRPAYHRTQPRANVTVVYTRQAGQNITIIGIGNHVGPNNNNYSITFDDGRTCRCNRA